MIASLPPGDALRRSPVPAATAVALGVALLHAAQRGYAPDADSIVNVTAAAFFGAVVGQSVGRHAGAIAGAALAGAAVAFADALMVTVWLLVAALALSALVAPAAVGRQGTEEAWRALVRTATAAGLGLLGAIVVSAGTLLLALGTDALLGLGWSGLAWSVVVPLSFGWLAPAIFLSLASGERDDRVAEALGLVARTFARLVLTPLLAIYACVLAVYIVRIAMLGELPSGELGWIVPLFGTTGALTVLALSSREERGGLVRLFLRGWFPLTVIPVALYAIALAIRIETYGVTPERYLGILVGAWLAMLAVAFSLVPRADVRLIPVTLALVLTLGSVGPWSLRPVVAKSLGDRVLAALPDGDVAAIVPATSPEKRRPLCSPVAVLSAAGELRRVERVTGRSDLESLCAALWLEEEADVIAISAPGPVAIPVAGRVVLSGPHVFYGEDRREHAAAGLELQLSGASLTVRAAGVTETFDLAAIAEAWRAQGGETPHVVAGDRMTLAVTQIRVSVSPSTRRVEQVTIFVAVPRAALSVTVPPPAPGHP